MSLLDYVAKDGFIGGGTILGGVFNGEAWSRSKVAGLDGFEPCRSDWKASGRMEVPYQRSYARQVVCTVGS